MTGIGRLACLSSLIVAAGCSSASSPVAPSAPSAVASLAAGQGSDSVAALAARRGGAVASTTAITVDRGGFDYRGKSGSLMLRGSRQFLLSAHVDAAAVIVAVDDSCLPGCAELVTMPLLSVQTGNGVTARVTLDGVTYSSVGDASGGTSASLSFAANAVPVPSSSRSKVTVSTPFTLLGQFTHMDGTGAAVSESLGGHGTARASLAWNGTRWIVESLSYTFEP